VQHPQHESSHSIVGEANEITTVQVNHRQQTTKHGERERERESLLAQTFNNFMQK